MSDLDTIKPTERFEGAEPPDLPVQARDRPEIKEGDLPQHLTNVPDYLAPGAYEKLVQGAEANLAGKSAEQEQVNEFRQARLHRTEQEQQRAFNAESYAASQVPPPWDADKERAERFRSPLEAFGSSAMVFANIAAAFTKRPMINALNAGAAAMEAIHKSDMEGYQAAHEAWKENTDLAIKRFNMQHTQFQDTQHLFDTNLEAWKAENLAIASKFNDAQMMNYLQNGLYPEAMQLMDQRLKLADSMQEHARSQDLAHAQIMNYNSWVDDIAKRHGPDGAADWGKPQFDAATNLKQLIMRMEADPRQAFGTERIVAQGMLERLEATGQLPTATELATLHAMAQSRLYGAGAGRTGGIGGADLTEPRQKAAFEAQQRDKYLREGKPPEEAVTRAREDANRAFPPTISGNRADALVGLYQRAGHAVDIIDRVEQALIQHGAMTGLGGRITRPAETIGNWFGNDQTARHQFATDISQLQMWAMQLLTERALGRPLAAEESQLARIVPGLSLGDTTQSTAHTLQQLRQLLGQLRADWKSRIPSGTVPEPGGAPPPASAIEGKWWEGDK